MALRFGIIGCGGMAGWHARKLAQLTDAEVVAVCDVSMEIAEGFITRNLPSVSPKPVVFTNSREFFGEAALDAVVIVSPHTLHYQHGMEALEAGCHVFMEKPMVTNSVQAKELAAKVEEMGKVFVIGYNTPCSPEFNFLRRAIRSERFGKLEVVNGYLSQNWLNATRGSWRQDPTLSGGGQAYDSGAHLFNSLVWSVECDIDQVYAMVDHHGSPVDINSVTSIRFTNGVMASIVVGGNCVSDGAHMVFLFERGRVEINGWFAGWIKVFDDKGEMKYPDIPDRPIVPMENFIDAILGRDEARTGPINGIHQSQLMDAVYASADQNRPVKTSELNDLQTA